MSEPKQEDVNDLLLELENVHAELKAFSERLATALSTLEWFLETSEKVLGIEKQVKEKKLATPEQRFIIQYLMDHLGEYKDREKLLSMSFEDAEKTIKELYEKWQNRVKQIEASSKPLPSPVEGIKEAIEVKPQPVLAKPATKRQKLYIMDLAKKLNENLDLNKLSNMSSEDASVLIRQLKEKLEKKKVTGQ
jgi:hypothetical protein